MSKGQLLSGKPHEFRGHRIRSVWMESDYTLRELELRIDALRATADNPFLPRMARYNASLEITSIRQTLADFLKKL